MSALTFTLRQEPPQRLDLSPLLPHLLDRKSEKQIASLVISTTKERLRVGDMFKIRLGDADKIRFAHGSARFDRIGCGMTSGTITVAGDVGLYAGRMMEGGTLTIEGNAGHWAASGLKAGRIAVHGNCGDFLGGPFPGEMAGMRGGIVHVAGSAGARAGDRMRRGIISVDGGAGDYAGSRMIAGTLIVSGRAARLPGYLMKRGTIVLGRGADALSPTFVESGSGMPAILGLMARELARLDISPAALRRRQFARFGGDTAVLGKGELFSG